MRRKIRQKTFFDALNRDFDFLLFRQNTKKSKNDENTKKSNRDLEHRKKFFDVLFFRFGLFLMFLFRFF